MIKISLCEEIFLHLDVWFLSLSAFIFLLISFLNSWCEKSKCFELSLHVKLLEFQLTDLISSSHSILSSKIFSCFIFQRLKTLIWNRFHSIIYLSQTSSQSVTCALESAFVSFTFPIVTAEVVFEVDRRGRLTMKSATDISIEQEITTETREEKHKTSKSKTLGFDLGLFKPKPDTVR